LHGGCSTDFCVGISAKAPINLVTAGVRYADISKRSVHLLTAGESHVGNSKRPSDLSSAGGSHAEISEVQGEAMLKFQAMCKLIKCRGKPC